MKTLNIRVSLIKNIIIVLSIIIFAFQVRSCKTQKRPLEGNKDIALVNGLLIDGTGAEPVPDITVLIQGKYIRDIGGESVIDVPADVEIINVQGSTILPGFINAHVHDGYNANNLREWAKAGVTTVRDLGADPNSPLFSNRDKLNTDIYNARLVAAGPLLTAPNGYPIAIFNSPAGFPLTSMEDARQKVGQLLSQGADIIKLTVESGVLWNQNLPMLSPEICAEIVKITHEGGKKVTTHITVTQDLARAIEAGTDDIAHMAVDNVTDELIEKIVKENTIWVPTLELWNGVGNGLDKIAINNLARFVKAGGKVALGTDYEGYSTPFDLGMPITEIRLMQQAGMTPMQIIVAATSHAAQVCNLGDQLGVLEKDKIADILVVRGNPLEDINALTNVHTVIHNGVIIR